MGSVAGRVGMVAVALVDVAAEHGPVDEELKFHDHQQTPKLK